MHASTPENIHALLEAAFRAGDLDAYTQLHEADATTLVPPDGRQVTGRDEIRKEAEAIVTLAPRFTSRVVGKLEANGLALTYARWELAATGPDGSDIEMSGRGTIVSRRQPDGSWRIVLDNPLSP